MTLPEFLSTFLIALGLAADCFAVALSGSMSMPKLRYVQVLRTGLAFGIAQALMPFVGWLVGRTVINYVAGFDHWIAFGLLVFIGGKMLWEALNEKDERKEGADISRGLLLLTLALATSIDALAVGLSFAFLDINILAASLLIGAVTLVITHLGFYLGRKAGVLLGRNARLAGGIILIGIGLKILISHLMGG
jgi:manganese efflux pump family protein